MIHPSLKTFLLFTLLPLLPLSSHASQYQNTLALDSILCLFYENSFDHNATEGKTRDLVRRIIQENHDTVIEAQKAIRLNTPKKLKNNLIPLLHNIKNTLHSRMNIHLPLDNATPSYLISKLNQNQCQKQRLHEEATAEWFVGTQFYHGYNVSQDYPTALAWFTRASQKHLHKAHHWLGILHFQGLGTPQNYTLAFQHFLKASENKYLPEASYSLGFIYENGLGTKKNMFKAHQYYLHAAEHNLTHAQTALARLYSHEPLHINFIKAYKWWAIAENNGNKNATSHKQLILSRMTSLQKWEAQRRTRVWLRNHSQPQTLTTAKL